MLKLVRNLRERRVFRGAGYYILGAWLLLQVGDVIVEPAALPAWTMTALLYGLVAGFPIAMFLSWRYDITEHGIVRTVARSDTQTDPGVLRLGAADYLIMALLLGLVVVVVYQALPGATQVQNAAGVADSPTPVEAPPGTVAVLPFADLSQDQTQQFLGAGISDTVLHMLSQVDGIQVTARTSSFAFQDQKLPIQQIAEALRVAHVLEGSVQQQAGKVRIIARLIDAATGAEVWSGYYDRAIKAIFDIQDEIAQEVVTALKVNVLAVADVKLDVGYRPDMEAFEAVVLGREALSRGTSESFVEAHEYFQKAMQIDPQYALAYTLLAEATARLPQAATSRFETIEKAQELNRQALDLDPLLPEAHAGQAHLLFATKDLEGAEKAAKRALELRPSYAEVYALLADLYRFQGRTDDGLAMARKAVELDPEDIDYQMELAAALWSVGRSEAALGQIRNAILKNPEIPYNFTVLARRLAQLGRSGEAQYWTERALNLDPSSQHLRWNYCLGLAQLWAIDDALACMEKFLEDFPDDPEAVNAYANLVGDTDRGLSNARRQVEENPNFWYRKVQLSDWLVVAGANEETVALFRSVFPGLYGDPPKVTDFNIWAARNLVIALQALGNQQRSRQIIDSALEHLSLQRKLQGDYFTTGVDDVFFLSRAGETSEAFDRLREAIDRGWQFYSFYEMLYPWKYPQSFRDDPRFAVQVDRLREIMAKERAWYAENRERDLLNAG